VAGKSKFPAHWSDDEIIAMLDVAEYGIGLETMAGIIVEENKQIDINLLREINSLAAEMQLRDEPFMGQLNSFFETKAAPLAS